MNSLLEQLHDIEGLDQISSWPLAMGWWVVIGISTLLVIAIVGFAIFKVAFKRSWKSDTFQKLSLLEKNLSEASARETVITLSEYLRRIALRRFSRNECAGLVGRDWLKWLANNDPKQFDWETKGNLLIEVPYAPVNSKISSHQIKDLIHATRNWVR